MVKMLLDADCMSYKVTWLPKAEDGLAELWNDASDRKAVRVTR